MRLLRAVKDKTARYIMLGIAIFTILFLIVIGVSLFFKALPIMKEKSLWILLTSANWKPFKGDYGFLPFIFSTFYVSLIAIIIALPFSILTSIYLNSYASKNVKRLFVIYGVWGTLTIVPLIANKIAPRFVAFSSGYTVLAGGIVLAVMIIPLLISIMVEVFRSIPKEMTDASLSMGATKWQTVKKVILRKSVCSGIIKGFW